MSSKSFRSVGKQQEEIKFEQLQCVAANDDHFQMMAVVMNLRKYNINTQLEAVNGLEVLQYIQCNPNIKLDFILLDLNMPIMNGFEACRQIIDFYQNSNMFKLEKSKMQRGSRSSSEKSVSKAVNEILDDMFHLPLMIAYSGHVDDEVRQKCKEAGFKVVIDSPLTVQKVQGPILSNLSQRS